MEPEEAVPGIVLQGLKFEQTEMSLSDADYLPQTKTVKVFADFIWNDETLVKENLEFFVKIYNEEADWSEEGTLRYDEEGNLFVGDIAFSMISKEGIYEFSEVYYMEEDEKVFLELPVHEPLNLKKEHVDRQAPEILECSFAVDGTYIENGTEVTSSDSVQFIINLMEEKNDDNGQSGINFVHMILSSEDGETVHEYYTEDFTVNSFKLFEIYLGAWRLDIPVAELEEGTWRVSYLYVTDLYDNSIALDETEYSVLVVSEKEHTEHEYEIVVTEPTCKEQGYTTYTCKICGEQYVDNYVETVDHDYMAVVVKPTCTKRGYTAYVCGFCDAGYAENYVDAKGHTYSSWVTLTEPTCTEEGERVRYCEVCDVAKSESIEKLDHEYFDIPIEPTCTKEGYTVHLCERCDDMQIDTYVKAKGHTYGSWKTTKKATCAKTGTKTRVCTVDDCDGKQTKSIAKKDHTEKVTTTKATLKANGKQVTKCTVCEKTLKTKTVYKPTTIKFSKVKYTYTGKAITPSLVVKDSEGNSLKKGTDYTVSYSGARKATGRYTATIKFKGKYSGEKKLTFYVLPVNTSEITTENTTTTIKATWSRVAGASGYKVELLSAKGEVLKTSDTTKVTCTFKELAKGVIYKIKVTAYKTISDKKQTSPSSTTVIASTKPIAPTLSTKAGTKKVTVSWNKRTGNGYELVYSTSSKFTSARTLNVKDPEIVKKVVLNLQSGKTYYFKIRTYKMVGEEKIYSDYSKVVKTKVK